MSRIQTILDKAEREGTARRFRGELAPHERRDGQEGLERREEQERLAGREMLDGREVLPIVDRVGTVPEPAPVTPREPEREFRPRMVEPRSLTPAADPVPDAPVATPVREQVDVAESPTAVAEAPAAAPAPEATAAGTVTEETPGTESAPAVTRLPLSPALVAALHPNALASEQFRTLRSRIVNSANGRGARSLLLTSPGRGEGKSVMAANLALTMGQEIQQRVCLVDASLRDASIHALFGLPETPGLVDVLTGEATLDEALVALDEYQLTILPAGRLPRHPAELLAGREMRRVLDVLRSRFDRVVIDAPPAAPMADVSILAPLVDGVLMVVRAGVTATPDLQHALGTVDENRMLGVVLNDIQA